MGFISNLLALAVANRKKKDRTAPANPWGRGRVYIGTKLHRDGGKLIVLNRVMTGKYIPAGPLKNTRIKKYKGKAAA